MFPAGAGLAGGYAGAVSASTAAPGRLQTASAIPRQEQTDPQVLHLKQLPPFLVIKRRPYKC